MVKIKNMNIKLKQFINGWRKYVGLPLLIFQTSALLFIESNIVHGCIALLWLTIPCGIKNVNINKWLWYLRQLFFITAALMLFFK